MKKALVNEDGLVLAFYAEEIHGEDIPDGTVDVTDEQWREILQSCGSKLLVDGEIVDAEVPPIEIPEPVTVVYSVDLWSRMTEDEADQVGAAMDHQPFRVRKIFESASTFRSDHELWPLLVQIATTLFGEERAAQILAPSSQQ
ncbi:hypothetical protein J8N08_16745 [Agrobacterium tumefaciens]|uniref:hypothetical protein n=1 Tax=Agrobacterium tumefaciens TaxID=358 RepID=UPI001BB4D3F1|nr:hypothetical protein J8N08_16745 [Agrobacterium tumefaciens]